MSIPGALAARAPGENVQSSAESQIEQTTGLIGEKIPGSNTAAGFHNGARISQASPQTNSRGTVYRRRIRGRSPPQGQEQIEPSQQKCAGKDVVAPTDQKVPQGVRKDPAKPKPVGGVFPPQPQPSRPGRSSGRSQKREQENARHHSYDDSQDGQAEGHA